MKDLLIGIWCLGFSTWVYVLTREFPHAERIYKAPAAYPRVLLFLLTLFGIMFISRGIWHLKMTGSVPKRALPMNITKPLIVMVSLIGYFFLLYACGFIVATFIFLIGAYRVFGGSVKQGVVFSALLTLGEYGVFGLLLKVPLPQPFFW